MTIGLPTRETIETSSWSDRDLMLRTYYQVVETNGTVKRHEFELYGDPEHGIVGMKEQAALNTEYRTKLSAQWRVVAVMGGTVVTAIFTVLGIILAGR